LVGLYLFNKVSIKRNQVYCTQMLVTVCSSFILPTSSGTLTKLWTADSVWRCRETGPPSLLPRTATTTCPTVFKPHLFVVSHCGSRIDAADAQFFIRKLWTPFHLQQMNETKTCTAPN
jgi:hypothetical protein